MISTDATRGSCCSACSRSPRSACHAVRCAMQHLLAGTQETVTTFFFTQRDYGVTATLSLGREAGLGELVSNVVHLRLLLLLLRLLLLLLHTSLNNNNVRLAPRTYMQQYQVILSDLLASDALLDLVVLLLNVRSVLLV